MKLLLCKHILIYLPCGYVMTLSQQYATMGRKALGVIQACKAYGHPPPISHVKCVQCKGSQLHPHLCCCTIHKIHNS